MVNTAEKDVRTVRLSTGSFLILQRPRKVAAKKAAARKAAPKKPAAKKVAAKKPAAKKFVARKAS